MLLYCSNLTLYYIFELYNLIIILYAVEYILSSLYYSCMAIDIEHLGENFAKKLRIERAKRKLSQEKLAELADLHRTTISAIEREKFYPTIDNVAKIANALGLSISELFDFNF